MSWFAPNARTFYGDDNNPGGSESGDSSAARTAFSASLTVRTLRHAAFISPRGSA